MRLITNTAKGEAQSVLTCVLLAQNRRCECMLEEFPSPGSEWLLVRGNGTGVPLTSDRVQNGFGSGSEMPPQLPHPAANPFIHPTVCTN